MADNFLERHREEYEKRKAEWLRRKQRRPKLRKTGSASAARFPETTPARTESTTGKP